MLMVVLMVALSHMAEVLVVAVELGLVTELLTQCQVLVVVVYCRELVVALTDTLEAKAERLEPLVLIT